VGLFDPTTGNLAFGTTRALNVVDLAESLLRYCRAKAPEIRRRLSRSDGRRIKHVARANFCDLLDGWGAVSCWPADLLSEIGSRIAHIHGQPDPLAVRALAQAVDASVSFRFAPAFSDLYGAHVAATPLQAVPSRPAVTLDGKVPDLRLDLYDDDPGQLQNLRMLPDSLPLDLHIQSDPRFSIPLAASLSRRPFRAVSVHVGNVLGIDEISARYEIESDEDEPYSALEVKHPARPWFAATPPIKYKKFRGVKAKHTSSEYLEILKGIPNANPAVVLFPEFSMNESGVAAVKKFIATTAIVSPLIVAGSSHAATSDPSQHENNLFAAIRSGDETIEMSHAKLTNFEAYEKRSGVHLIEDNVRGTRLTVYLLNDGTLACFLVCKDLLVRSVIDVLLALRVSYVIVSAYSAKTEEFLSVMSALATHCGTISLLACTGPASGPAAAMASPIDRRGIIRRVTPPQDLESVTLLLLAGIQDMKSLNADGINEITAIHSVAIRR
jgi:hypothetical protein